VPGAVVVVAVVVVVVGGSDWPVVVAFGFGCVA
jgi:hypothetical protein